MTAASMDQVLSISTASKEWLHSSYRKTVYKLMGAFTIWSRGVLSHWCGKEAIFMVY